MTLEEAREHQRRYREKRRRWARAIGRPYSQDIGKPDPGEIDTQDGENG